MGPQGVDSLVANVEGYVTPPQTAVTVTLSRGEVADSVVTRNGYYQFSGIDFGLYILEAKAAGLGGYSRTLVIGQKHVLVDRIALGEVPWPMTSVFPEDSLSIGVNAPDSTFSIIFGTFMDRKSVEGAIRVDPVVPFSITWATGQGGLSDRVSLQDALFITFYPSGLEVGKSYGLTMDTTAKTVNGAHLDRIYRYRVVKRKDAGGVSLVEFGNAFVGLGPADTIPVTFSESMDQASVEGSIALSPSALYSREWDQGRRRLYLIPETRWPDSSALRVSFKAGYQSSAGRVGAPVAETYSVLPFGPTIPRPGSLVNATDEFDMAFNLPIDPASVRFSIESPASASAHPIAPNRLRWSLSGAAKGSTFTLRITSLSSLFGDTLKSPVSFRISSTLAGTFRIIDSAKASMGITPYLDSLTLATSWSASERLKSSTFQVLPFYPFSTKWTSTESGNPLLVFRFLQPVPADTHFILFPTSGALKGDTLKILTKSLEGGDFRPYYGETKVAMDALISMRWNTLIDTAGFAAHVSSVPPLDSLRVSHDTLGGSIRTNLRHGGLTRNQEYVVKVGGVTDLFSRPLRDTVVIRFRTAP